MQVSSSNTYSTNGILNGNVISVFAEDLGCRSLSTQVGPITVISGPALTSVSDMPGDSICAGDSIGFLTTPSGYLNYEFFVNGISVQSGTDTSYGSTTLSDGDVITVVASDQTCPGPADTAAVVTVNPIPTATLSSSTNTICFGDGITFTAIPAGYSEYEFFLNGISVQIGAINTYSSNTINDQDTLTVTPRNLGCDGFGLDSVVITVNPIPVISFVSDTVCSSNVSNFVIDASSPNISNYVWNYGDGTIGGGPVGNNSYTDTGTYVVSLTVTDLNNCMDSTFGVAQINPLPIALATAVPTITTILNPNIDFTDASDPPAPAVISSWFWDFGDGNIDSISQNPTYTYADTGDYIIELEVTNEFGCSDKDIVAVKIEPEFMLHAPNTFTPNGDGINETFIPEGIGLENNFEMFIYDRWGDLIFESKGIKSEWDGTANDGRTAQEDVYVWIVFATDHNEARHQYVGHVTLVR